MCWRNCPIAFAVALLGLGVDPTQAAKAGFYTFTGAVTSVDDPFGAFSGLAAVGAPVNGSFQYSDTASYPDPFQINPFVTIYGNSRMRRPGVTGLELTINGVTQLSSPFSLTNLQVGDGVPPGTPFFPAGDLFRYFDTLTDPPGRQDALVDYAQFDVTESFAVPFASIFLVDPTGGAFSSQNLPRGPLPLAALTNRFGEFSFFDGNFEDNDFGSVRFRIDGIQAAPAAVPVPGSLVLMACGGVPGMAVWLLRRGRRGSSSEPKVTEPGAAADGGA